MCGPLLPFAPRLQPTPPVNVVGFDTATDDTVAGASVGGRIAIELRKTADGGGRPRHSQDLLSAVNEAADCCGGWGGVDRIAVGVGPGTFTGIRIGIATARGLAIATGIELVPVSTLEALAWSMAKGGLRLPVLDAKRGEVFAALYADDGSEVWSAAAFTPQALAERVLALETRPLAGGPGAVRFRDDFNRAGLRFDESDRNVHNLCGGVICELGARGPAADPSNPLEPEYLRPPDAQLWLARDNKKSSD